MSADFLASAVAGGCGGLVVLAGPVIVTHLSRLVELLPIRSTSRRSAPEGEAGYAANVRDAQAAYVRLREQQVSEYADRLAAGDPELRKQLRVFEGRLP